MSAAAISLLLSIGAGAWIYSKVMKYTGNNTQQSAIVTGISCLLIFFVVFMILGLLI